MCDVSVARGAVQWRVGGVAAEWQRNGAGLQWGVDAAW
jgi:hypothetical protein